MTLALDGDATPTQATATGTIAATLTTANPGDLIVVLACAEQTTAPVVSSVTGTGLTFTRRGGSTATSGGRTSAAEVWYATATGALSAVSITVTYAANFDDAVLFAFGVSGNTPAFDTNGSLPAAHIPSDGHWYAAASTDSAAPFVFAVAASHLGGPAGSTMTPASLTQTDTKDNTNGVAQMNGAWGYGQPVGALSSTNVGWSTSATSAGTVVLVDAITEPAPAAPPSVPHLLGHTGLI